MIGTSFPYAEWLSEQGAAKCVEIDIDGSMIGVRYPNDVSLVGDAKDLDQMCGQNPTLVFAVLVNEDLNQVS
ncbi:MAG: hypothetical protein ACR2K2_03545 [Mycobacteriales bacterium]